MRFVRFALLGLFALVIAVTVRGERADACGCCAARVGELTTFDPAVLGEPELGDLDYDPYVSGFGTGCSECFTKALTADWHAYWKDVTDADWQKILMTATSDELAKIQLRLAGKVKTGPAGYDTNSIWKTATPPAKVVAAITLVQLAREMEPQSTLESYDENGAPKKNAVPSPALLARAKAGLKSAPDPFLAQRFGFQAMKILFYRKDWKGAIAFFDNTHALTALEPGLSTDLPWRARYYLAGALKADHQLARANLELALVHSYYPPLAGLAAKDFHPKEDVDWHDSLQIAKTAPGKTALWRLVGMKLDPLVAMQEILKLDPKSKLVAVLLVREMTKTELLVGQSYGQPTPEDIAAQKKEFGAIEKLAKQILATGGDRPWLMELLLGHIAAKRGDLAATRTHTAAAVALAPNNPRVAGQAKASLSLALAFDWKINPQREQALAEVMNGIRSYDRTGALYPEIRGQLAQTYAKAGKMVEAEFLDSSNDMGFNNIGRPTLTRDRATWAKLSFIKQMIAQLDKSSTDFERFLLVDTSFTKKNLQHDLALRYLLDGDLQTSARLFETTPTDSTLLNSDPFITHTIDSIEDDHQKFGNAKWTHATLASRLVELERTANGKGEPAAQAALLLGNALYNITENGNARSMLRNSHQATHDAHQAERWYKRAFELSTNQEFRAKAAFFAAKAELGSIFEAEGNASQDPNAPPISEIPKIWFPIVKKFSTTKYYKEVLAECGRFSRWVTP